MPDLPRLDLAKLAMLHLVGAGVGVNINTSTNVPTATTLAAGQIRLVVDADDQLVAYWNKAGTVRAFVIGTFLPRA